MAVTKAQTSTVDGTELSEVDLSKSESYVGGSRRGGGSSETTVTVPNQLTDSTGTTTRKKHISGFKAKTQTMNLSVLRIKMKNNNGGLFGESRIELEFTLESDNSFVSKNKFYDILTYETTEDEYTDLNRIDTFHRGIPYAYQFTEGINFDNETLGNFTIVAKDWSEFTSVSEAESETVVPNYIRTGVTSDGVNVEYSARIFIYTKTSSGIKKNCIGYLSHQDILSLFV